MTHIWEVHSILHMNIGVLYVISTNFKFKCLYCNCKAYFVSSHINSWVTTKYALHGKTSPREQKKRENANKYDSMNDTAVAENTRLLKLTGRRTNYIWYDMIWYDKKPFMCGRLFQLNSQYPSAISIVRGWRPMISHLLLFVLARPLADSVHVMIFAQAHITTWPQASMHIARTNRSNYSHTLLQKNSSWI